MNKMVEMEMEMKILNLAISYYYRHVGYSQSQSPYLWDQASQEYKNCFINLAKMDIEDMELGNE